MRGTDRFDLNHCRGHNHKPTHPHPSKRVIQGEGRAAYAAGLKMADNPYPSHAVEHRLWENGFLLEFVDRGCKAVAA